ncbi:MAG: hypothetical protein ABI831_20310 [Betaproteobacteria bacterium]
MNKPIFTVSLLSLAVLAGCASVPPGPSVMVLPGDGRTFDQFRYDDADCRNFATAQVGGAQADQVAADSAARSAILGTIIGAAAGGAIGGRHGAATGAGAGLLVGAVAGTGAAQGSAYSVQRRYDYAFQQCMYAKGHRIPGQARAYPPLPPPGQSYYAPPPGSAPPPPPGQGYYAPPPGSAPPPPPSAPPASR